VGVEAADEIHLTSAALTVACRPGHGFVVTSLVDRTTGLDALWRRQAFEPAAVERRLGSPGAASVHSFMDIFVGGWFPMFPSVAHAGSHGGAFALLHGEAARLPWTVTDATETSVAASVRTIRTPFEIDRAVALDGAEVVCRTRIRNVGREPAPFIWGEHPCFDRELFAGGRISLVASEGSVPVPADDPQNALLDAGQQLDWPIARTAAGGSLDVAAIPAEPDGRHDHICVTLSSGVVEIGAPRAQRVLRLRFDLDAYPYALVWQNYRAPGGSCWGAIDTFTVEPSTNPGRDADDAFAAGTVRTLRPGEEAGAELGLSWHPDERENDREGTQP
jgi:galactose mutarotase-like enzyme